MASLAQKEGAGLASMTHHHSNSDASRSQLTHPYHTSTPLNQTYNRYDMTGDSVTTPTTSNGELPCHVHHF